MTQFNLNPSSSTAQILVVSVAVPAPVIPGVVWPSSPKIQGVQCKNDVSYRNNGGDGDIFLRIVDSFGNVLASFISDVVTGETGTVSLYFNMPANDIVIYAQVGVGSTVTDTSDPYTLEITLTIGTTLTLILPTSVEEGERVNFTGKLTRADVEPTDIQTIKIIDDVSGTIMATVSTSFNGNFSGAFTAPTTKGTYYYASEFGGASLALSMSVLEPSSSSTRRVAVGVAEVDEISNVSLAVSLATGITMLVVSLS